MKKSRHVRLMVTASLLAPFSGCAPKQSAPPAPDPNQNWDYGSQGQTFDPNRDYENNTYIAGLGYYHAYHHWWYPYPWNYYMPGFGYYGGGRLVGSPLTPIFLMVRPHPSRSSAWVKFNPPTPPPPPSASPAGPSPGPS